MKGKREEIIDCVIGMIEESGGGVDSISIRAIAEKMGISVGLINYYFKSKDLLMEECVNRFIGKIVESFPRYFEKYKDLNPLARLKKLSLLNLGFLLSHDQIATISILSDLRSPSEGDNTEMTAEKYLSLVKDCLPKRSDEELRPLTYRLVYSMQTSFLRRSVIKETLGIDFSKKEDVEAYNDRLIDAIVR
ncbi:MAG: TetR/AcrR family transcriptional regulator [Bacilli bacterium]|jgi:AcrR family transcriptional regulator|nr:TetR/AcrR family transcriptional regulator [Bacilli bacterium]